MKNKAKDHICYAANNLHEFCFYKHDIQMSGYGDLRWLSTHRGCRREPCMGQKLQTNVPWEIGLHHEQFDNHVPSHQNVIPHPYKENFKIIGQVHRVCHEI